MEEDYESVLFVARDAHVYRIPPRTSTEGYRAANWGDMGAPLWRGRLRVVEKGSGTPTTCAVRLEDADSGELFAVCPYKPTKTNTNGGVEAVLDSSRYFVLTIVDQDSGTRAFLGMGFPERSESFDFNVALQDWSKRQTPPQLASPTTSSDTSSKAPKAPSKDFSLKEGEVLSIKFGGLSTKKKATANENGLGLGGGGGFLLPPPPPPPSRR
ncbi:BQ5605_C031g10905 [Microbotryum silenes-dioicae]|uniref:BQ5605_C031g10905 protein n=1 Tax=Microbotryum silenes-dioicae TaxID=796604 RepID=A0A2X0MHP3_9BASI|nr:BQ5605_C031g10905 [Microbotryum silenes-dioicae]